MDFKVESKCEHCDMSRPINRYRGKVIHSIDGLIAENERSVAPCKNFDSECRHIAEPLGFYEFHWLPRRCRNGKLRFMRWLERHSDGSFTLGNRAF